METIPTPTTPDSSPPGASSGPLPPARRSGRARAVRTVCAWVLVVLTAVLVPIAVVTVWVVATLTSTAQYVATVGPVIRERVVTARLAQRGTNLLFEQANVSGHLTSLLPSRLSFVAQPLTNELHGIVENQLRGVLQSSWFQRFWDRANTAAHANVVGVLTGKPTRHARAVHRVVVDLTPVVQRAVAALDRHGIHSFDGASRALGRANAFQVHLVSSAQLGRAQHLFSLMTTMNWVVPVVAAVLLVGAVLVAPDRRKVLLRSAIGAAIGTVAVLGALVACRAFFVARAATHEVSTDVSGVVFDTVVRYLRHALWIALALEVATALVAVIAGPSRPARSLRAHVGTAARRAVALVSLRPVRSDPAAVRRQLRRCDLALAHRSGLRLGGIGVGAAVVVLTPDLTATTVLNVTLAVAAYLVVLELAFRWARRWTTSTRGTPGAG